RHDGGGADPLRREVDVDHAAPLVEAHRLEVTPGYQCAAGVVDQRVDRPGVGRDAGDEQGDVVGVGDVASHGRDAAGAVDGLERAVGDVGDGDAGAGGRELLGVGEAEPLRTPGDHDDAPLAFVRPVLYHGNSFRDRP